MHHHVQHSLSIFVETAESQCLGDGSMSMENLLCRLEDLSLDPNTHTKKCKEWLCISVPSKVGAEMDRLSDVSTGFNERPCLKGNQTEHIHTHIHMHMLHTQIN